MKVLSLFDGMACGMLAMQSAGITVDRYAAFEIDMENHQLQTVAAACGYDLTNHHHALADADACAWIAREIL